MPLGILVLVRDEDKPRLLFVEDTFRRDDSESNLLANFCQKLKTK